MKPRDEKLPDNTFKMTLDLYVYFDYSKSWDKKEDKEFMDNMSYHPDFFFGDRGYTLTRNVRDPYTVFESKKSNEEVAKDVHEYIDSLPEKHREPVEKMFKDALDEQKIPYESRHIKDKERKEAFLMGTKSPGSVIHLFFGSKTGVPNHPLGESKLIGNIFELAGLSKPKVKSASSNDSDISEQHNGVKRMGKK